MQKQQVIQEQFENSAMNEPHFDEEWTVLSARPVVPIAELKARYKRQFSLKLFGSFLLASSLGVLVALAAIRLREGRVPVTETSVSASEEPSLESSEESNLRGGDTTVPTEQTADAEVESAEPESLPTVDKPARRTEKADHNVAVDFEDDASEAAPAADSDRGSKPQPRLVEQWQEGRPRRVQQRRRANDAGAHHPRDLRNLEEIFEGSRP